ncbi:DUF4197 family protein [Candidatus Phycosocius spiralis]|uniref:DUF2059 domain-containing protein n=1 Tax=Candidatus Phycosocius spiralis TaxID=2815099 RepID=A0ABQ4PXM9_9PROT|nr:DUF4197 family protein [Candidatus Phycosocius spiralis]GIU67768.1 hypothetical protein PsB1_1922 [Candidatus Phycosocius spiralis]
MNYKIESHRRNLILAFCAVAIGFAEKAKAQSANQMLDELANVAAAKRAGLPTILHQIDQAAPVVSTPAQGEDPIRLAIIEGVRQTGTRLGKPDGFWGDARVRILLPAPLDHLQARLQPLRMGSSLVRMQISLNRVAESLMPKAQSFLITALSDLPAETTFALLHKEQSTPIEVILSDLRLDFIAALKPTMAEMFETSGTGALLDRIESRYGEEIKTSGGWSGLRAYSSASLGNTRPFLSAEKMIEHPAPAQGSQQQGVMSTKQLHDQMITYILDKAWGSILLYLEEALRPSPA